MRDELLAGAAALIEDRLDRVQRARLATLLERAARRYETLATQARADAAGERTA